MNISPTPDNPVAVADGYNVPVGATLQVLNPADGLLRNDTDADGDPIYFECGLPFDSVNKETISAAARLATLEYLAGTHLAEVIPPSAVRATVDLVPDAGVGVLGNKKMIEVAITWDSVAESCIICLQRLISGMVLEERHSFILEGECELS